MYNHVVIKSGKFAPIGWRIQTVVDFIEFKNFFQTMNMLQMKLQY
ncbi:MAG: hypothetical protein ACI9FW_000121 [Flavobacterium sp.]|jgi:hypothetical protein